MPLIHLKSSKEIPSELLPLLSRIAAEGIGKPEQYVMVTAETVQVMMSGIQGDAAYIEVKSLGGLSGEVNRALSAALCLLLEENLALPPERVYITFHALARDHWGWNGSTFG